MHSAGNLRSGSFVSRVAPSLRVCHRLCLTFSLFPLPPPSFSRTHIYIAPSFSLPLLLFLKPSLFPLPLSPPSPAVPSFFPLFLLLSGSDGEGNVSPAVSRLSPPRAPSAAFFRLFVLASSRAGNRRRLLASRLLSCLVKPRYSFERVAKSTKTPKALARVARVRACQC